MRVPFVYLGLLSLLLVTGCDVNCLDCNRAQPFPLFDGSVELDIPPSAVAGDTFSITVQAHPRVSGTGHVRLVAQAHLLRTVAPVQDSTGCYRAPKPSLCSNISLATDSAWVAFENDHTLHHFRRVVLEKGLMPPSDPVVSAIVKMDSVRGKNGILYSTHSRKGRDVVQKLHGETGTLIHRADSKPVSISLQDGS